MVLGLALPKPPVVDEESYLWIGAHLDPLHPYDWERVWQGSVTYAFAHPPLFLEWMGLVSRAGVVGARAAALPFALLLGWAVGRLAERTCHHAHLGAVTWLLVPTTLLGLQDSLMIDLPAVALVTAAVAIYREHVDDEGPALLFGGVCLGLAIETKYPMAAVVPVLLAHGLRFGWPRRFWFAAAAVVLAVELPLGWSYGTPHFLAVWSGRTEIAHDSIPERALGVIVRLGLFPLPFALVRNHARLWAVGGAVAIVSLAAVRPEAVSVSAALGLLGFAAAGATLLARATAAVLSPHGRRRKGDRDDALLLGGWVVAVSVSVLVFHNYAASRYLLPAVAPAALLLVRAAEDTPGGKALHRVSIVASAGLGLALVVADWRFARACVEVAERAQAAAREVGEVPGQFAGEWGFRWAMEKDGWSRLGAGRAATGVLVVATNSSPGDVPYGSLEPMRHVESRDTFPLRVVDLESNAGLYAETLGMLPFALGHGPLESATIFVPKAAP